VGFGPDATHTINKNSVVANVPAEDIKEDILSPKKIVRNIKPDNYSTQILYWIEKMTSQGN